MINILDIEPHVVSDDITGYAIAIMGPPGCGKTTLGSKIPQSLFLATEPGYKALPGVKAVDINSWTDVLQVVNQLKQPAAKERYKTIVIDTLDEFVFLAEQHIISANGVDDLTAIPWGRGYKLLEEALRKVFRSIVKDYGLLLIAHDGRKQDEENKDLYYASLNFNRKVKRVVMGLLDVLAYVETSRDSTTPSIMHFRSSELWEAKARFEKIVPSTIFSYDHLVKAIHDAVQGVATTSERQSYIHEDEFPAISQAEFETLLREVNELAQMGIEKHGLPTIQTLVREVLAGRKLSETTIDDYEIIRLLGEKLSALK